jgi:hypothetical protein
LGDGRIDVAGAGVSNDAILDAVGGVAGVEGGLMEDGELVLREGARGREVSGLFDPDSASEETFPVVGGGSGDDAVEVGGITLSLHKTLPASGGAPAPVGLCGGSIVEGGDDGLGLDGGLVDGAISEVDDLFRVAEGEASVGHGALVTGVGGRDSVALANGACHEAIPGTSGEAAVADSHKPVVPAGDGHPDLELDRGVGNRRDGADDAAECGQIIERSAGCAVVDGRQISFFNARERDGGVGEFETGEALADFGAGGRGEDREREESRDGKRCVPNRTQTYSK